MRFQIIVTPSGIGEINNDFPYGALYIASSLMEEGHEVRIESCDLERFDYPELARRVTEYKPDVIGISSVMCTAYKYVKHTTLSLKKEFPDIKIIVGGGLGSAAEMLLKNSGADIVVIGEGDITIKELAERIAKKEAYHDVAGIVFKEGDTIIETQPRSSIKNLDILKYPAFDLIDMSRYLIDTNFTIKGLRYYKNPDKRFFDSHRSKKMLRIIVSRGCISRCIFCYRPTAGLRHFSFRYIFDYLEYLIDRFKVNIFSFGDECFAPSKAWNWQFLEELRKRKLDIMFQVLGMRVDTVDYDILRGFKEMGCWMIEYGIESGSQKMLDIMGKGITVQQNTEVAEWTKKAGIYMSPNFLFGMPGETSETINESIEFLKKLNYGPYLYQYAYVLAVPGTLLYDYAKVTGLIKNEEKYLEGLYDVTIQNLVNTDVFINFTTEPFEKVKNWPKLLRNEMLKHNLKNKIIYLIYKCLKLDQLQYNFKRFGLRRTLWQIWVYFFGKRKKMAEGSLSCAVEQTSSERDRYMDVVYRFIDRNEGKLNLGQIIRQIEDDNRAIIK